MGGSGLVGSAIINQFAGDTAFHIYATYFTNQIKYNTKGNFKLNIDDLNTLKHLLKKINPEIVISCLRGDFKKQLLTHIRAGEFLRTNGGKLYFFSTTNVFDGNLNTPHFEDDIPISQTNYGKYKIACENKLIKILDDNCCILRIPQVWGKTSKRMANLLNSLENNEEITLYPKLFINTTIDVIIAKQLYYIINHNLRGIFHLTSRDIVNYKSFYIELIKRLGFSNTKISDNFEDTGYFSILSKRTNEFPSNLSITNNYVIDYLTK
ncbi:dTDP-4-dehydrorhamnose reductase [Clostridium acetobutylicum]|uniref:sugar nucleotide-binding protein n=1 Tax=Clostridium TaxID=1485 RepID=UPI000200A6BF|nr:MULTISPECIES: sugar nucleotide-binding protein [Clostridium]ADZ19570.1 dTDP-6-deoxy-L-mannose-dehydrogenase [Clostridium acetobutylicum EA 2018]AEI31284.1 dTDP-6-deoxy-L-mannose-dehydrogenase [Clostridium acetobutylicum DSM 1731]AWV80221.1 dTDP-4-dehydrorhamnose reductase [Clostridium acetobutylicum]MBC2392403.1 sugar nucleotide-binding protein [Clostridium acetobutylicum]MBC2583697.1 sugar nucleotide-binding protein [Clostridium acetobutylicum]